MKKHYKAMADYNQWMNDKLLASCDDLTPEQLSEDRGAFFKSILGTWNHIMVGDLIWLNRFAEKTNSGSLKSVLGEFPEPKKLDQHLFTAWTEFHQHRQKLDGTIVEFVEDLTEEQLNAEFELQTSLGKSFKSQLWLLMTHFFNHQTHHRGQLTDLLMQVGVDPGVTDLVAMVRDQQLALSIG